MRRVLLLLACATLAACSYREELNHFLHEFEELAKDKIYLEHVTNFTVLTAMKFDVKIELQDKVFHASLQPHLSLFHPDLVVKHMTADGYKSGSVNIHEYLEGSLIDEPGSRVLIHIKDNIVTGTIQTTDNEKYFIEPSHRHVKEPHNFHMIAYKLSDVKFNFTRPDQDGGHFCGHESHEGQAEFTDNDFEFMIPKSSVEDGFEYSRKKRDTDAVKKNRCPLALVGDYSFYDQVNGKNEANAINYMIGLIQQIDPLYRDQSLDRGGSDEFRDYGFSIKYIEVIMDQSETSPSSYKYYKDGYTRGVSDLLKNFAYGPWRPDYCLAHLFTNYDFDGGVLGLAYVAAASASRVGGVCTKTYSGTLGKRSLNVGLTTCTNYNRVLLTSELVFVTGHEFGHNWGSSHDSDTSADCAPKGNRFMMYPAAVDGSQPNNQLFSPCSKQAINDVLVSKADSCFDESGAPVCGNSIVDKGEECDQGMVESACCKDCKLTSSSQCEPVNDDCCGTACRYESGKVCLKTESSEDNSVHCVKDYTCQLNTTSRKYDCIKGAPVTDGITCFDNGKCADGKCQDICAYNGKIACMCSEKKKICKQCCKDTPGGECKIYLTLDKETELVNGKICINGSCLDGECEISAQDIQEKFWDVIDRLDANMLLRWFKNNIVFTIIVFTSIFWIPISFFVNWLDDKYDLGAMDDILGSSKAERKPDTAGSTLLLQERKSLETKGSVGSPFLYPRLENTNV